MSLNTGTAALLQSEKLRHILTFSSRRLRCTRIPCRLSSNCSFSPAISAEIQPLFSSQHCVCSKLFLTPSASFKENRKCFHGTAVSSKVNKADIAFWIPSNIKNCNFSQFLKMKISVEQRGSVNSGNYKLYFRNENGPISPFHDIPLKTEGRSNVFNMVVEVPRWTNAKMEISTKDPLNPIKQDVKKGNLRYVANCFPHHGYIWNYGALPQTWEDPNRVDEVTGCKGDNDPVDICELGSKVHPTGAVVPVKILGCFALIDEGETDWKILAIDINDPLADKLHDVQDVEKIMPGYLRATVEWFRIYKIPDGKPENQFAFNGEPKGADFALKVIRETNVYWNDLVAQKIANNGIALQSATNKSSPSYMSPEKGESIVKSNPEMGPNSPLDPMVNKWHYVTVNPNGQ